LQGDEYTDGKPSAVWGRLLKIRGLGSGGVISSVCRDEYPENEEKKKE